MRDSRANLALRGTQTALNLPIYFINLASRLDRRAFIESQLNRLGLAAKRIEALPSGDPAIDPRAGIYLGPAEAACAASHLICWRALLAAPGSPEWALVLEDDGILSEALPSFLEEFLAAATDIPADALQLEVRRRPVRVLPHTLTLPSGRALAPFRSTREGGACYLISRRAVTTLLARDDLFYQPIDLTIFRPFHGPGQSIRTLLADPGLCMQLDEIGSASGRSRSDVAASRTAPTRLEWTRRRRFYLASINLIDHLAHLPRGLRRRVIPFDGNTTEHH